MTKTRDMQIAEILEKNFKPTRTATFINGDYVAYLDAAELKEMEAEARIAAQEKMKADEVKAFAYVYAYYDYADYGKLQSAHFYSGYPKTGAEYDKLAELENIMVRAIFTR